MPAHRVREIQAVLIEKQMIKGLHRHRLGSRGLCPPPSDVGEQWGQEGSAHHHLMWENKCNGSTNREGWHLGETSDIFFTEKHNHPLGAVLTAAGR